VVTGDDRLATRNPAGEASGRRDIEHRHGRRRRLLRDRGRPQPRFGTPAAQRLITELLLGGAPVV
jgi:hypothetical protein